MNVSLRPGTYVVAVSGGVDSMVMLDILRHVPEVSLVVAHFDHGMRSDSVSDREFVQEAAATYKFAFVYGEGKLDPQASEAAAREARYAFLRRVKNEYEAQAIITAHHQDDLLETAILNILRGTGRKGLSSLGTTDDLIRPLTAIPKQEILQYAHDHGIAWQEDSTNKSEQYLRNYLRLRVLPRLPPLERQKLLLLVSRTAVINPIIDSLLLNMLAENMAADGGLHRKWFAGLPHRLSCELMATWLRSRDIREFDRKTIERLVVAAKVAQPGKRLDVNTGNLLEVGKTTFRLISGNVS